MDTDKLQSSVRHRPQTGHVWIIGRGCSAPGISETYLCEYRVHSVTLFAAVISFFVFHRWTVTIGLEKSFIVEPPDPFEGSQFNLFEAFPGPRLVDQFCFKETDDAFGQGIII